jgi:hypothetical protein
MPIRPFGADQFTVRAGIGTPGTDDYVDLGLFSNKSGGDTDSPTNQTYPGGMQPAVVRGGQRTQSDVVLQRTFQYGDAGLIINAQPRCGRAVASCYQQPLDADGHAYGAGFTWTGLLKAITTPSHDASSEADTTWSLTITPSTTLGAINT